IVHPPGREPPPRVNGHSPVQGPKRRQAEGAWRRIRRSMAGLSGKPRHKASAWRQVAAPLAGDRSLRGLAALKRLKPEQREALQRRLEVREYRRAELIYQPTGAGGAQSLRRARGRGAPLDPLAERPPRAA